MRSVGIITPLSSALLWIVSSYVVMRQAFMGGLRMVLDTLAFIEHHVRGREQVGDSQALNGKNGVWESKRKS